MKIVLKTEMQPPKNFWIDKMPDELAIQTMLINQEEALYALQKALPQIKVVIETVYKKLINNNKSRLIYAGAGTSIRIAVQDAVELYPTFGWPRDRIAFMIAGGSEAILNSVEGAEDDITQVQEICDNLALTENDVVIGLAASGNTPFTKKCIKLSRKKKCLSVAISNNKNGVILKESDLGIILDTGYEIIAGSTRLKAATAQKICLNIISSMLMTKMGFVKNGLMNNFVVSNKKLKQRKTYFLELLK